MSNLLEIKNLTIGIHENGGEYTAVDGISSAAERFSASWANPAAEKASQIWPSWAF